jgi:hypothetical protein
MVSRETADGDLGEPLLQVALARSEAAMALLRGDQLVVEYANPAHRDLFGWPVGSSLRRAAPGPTVTTPRATARTVLATGDPARIHHLPVGRDRAVRILFSAVPSTGPAGVLMVAIDITDQVQARRRAEARSQRLTVLDQATAAVTADMDPHRELLALADTVVPSLADACAVYLVDHAPRGRAAPEHLRATRLTCVIDPALGVPPPAPEIRLLVPAIRPVSRAVRSRQTVLARNPERSPRGWGERWLDALAPHSLMAVPLGRPEVVAVVSFVATGHRPPYQASDVALISEITGRADVAFGHALQLQHANEVALVLQRGLLSDPAHVDWLDIAVRYRPAVPGLEVCGDWYDTLALPDGGLGLAVGDVVGHDLYAVSTMSQLRSMVQALACQPGAEPGGVLTALNRLSSHLGMGALATLVYGRLTREPGFEATFTWANAGHPPPLLVSPDGAVSVLDRAASPLLGLTDRGYRQASVPVPAGGRLLLYTDGLIEDPDRPSGDPIGELADAAGGFADLGLDDLCDRLIATAPTADDIALLAVQVRP